MTKIYKVLARDWKFKIKDQEKEEMVEINGINDFSLSPSKNTAEGTTFSSGGWLEHVVSTRGLSVSLSGYRAENKDTGERDEGQELVEEYGMETGDEATAEFEMTSPGGEVIEFEASVNTTPAGGGLDDNASWEAELEVTGKPEIVEITGTVIVTMEDKADGSTIDTEEIELELGTHNIQAPDIEGYELDSEEPETKEVTISEENEEKAITFEYNEL